jgi:hypothetical protein
MAPPQAKRIGELGYFPTYVANLALQKKLVDSVDIQSGMVLSETLQERAFNLAVRRMTSAIGE